MFRNRKGRAGHGTLGQSTVEYIVLVAAVIAVFIVFENNPKTPTGFRKTINAMLVNSIEDINDRSDKLERTHEGTSQRDSEKSAKAQPSLIVNAEKDIFTIKVPKQPTQEAPTTPGS